MKKYKYVVGGLIAALITYAAILLTFFPETAQARLIAGVTAHNHSSALAGGSTLAPSGAVTSTKPCAANYTRKFINYCQANSLQNPGSPTSVCTALTMPAADAKGLKLDVRVTARATNVVSQKSSEVDFSTVSDCSVIVGIVLASIREFVAVAATTNLMITEQTIDIMGTGVYAQCVNEAAATGTCVLNIVGYFD